jgi:hypothetical protein
MKHILLVASMIVVGLCPGCGPGADSELQALGANCHASARLAQSDGGLDEQALAELMETCKQRVSSTNKND